MSGKWMVVFAGSMMLATVAGAQAQESGTVFRRAQAMVNDGNAAAGRALVDSMVSAATPGTAEHSEAIYWRAVLAATASDAEMDYKRIIVDYPLSPRIPDVLIRVAQLEIARGDYDAALRHLDRLAREAPTNSMRARAGYWTARVLFEKNDVQRACLVNAQALASTTENDVELRNQISYLNQRCPAPSIASASPPAASAPTASPPTASAPTASPRPALQPPARPRDVAPTSLEAPARETVPAPAPTGTTRAPARTTPAPSTSAPASPSTARSTERSTPAAGTSRSESTGQYSVQVAAFNRRSQADAFAARLKTRGYEARVSGEAAPFRVRIGRYATRAQASAVQRSLKAKQIDGFVVQAEVR